MTLLTYQKMNTYGVMTLVIVYTQLATSKPTEADLVNGKCRQKLDSKPPKNWRNDENYLFKWEEGTIFSFVVA